MSHPVVDGPPEGKQLQGRPTEVDGHPRTPSEVSLVPAVTDDVTAVHVAGYHGGITRPGPVRAVLCPRLSRQVTRCEQVPRVELTERECSTLDVHDVSEPRPLAEEGGEQAAR